MKMGMELRTDIWRWRANSDSVESPGELSRSASRTNITLVGQFNCIKYPPNQGMLDATCNQGKPSELSWLAKHCLDECIRWLILHENRACAIRVCRTCVDSSKAGLRDPRPSKRSSRNCHGPSLTPANRERALTERWRVLTCNLIIRQKEAWDDLAHFGAHSVRLSRHPAASNAFHTIHAAFIWRASIHNHWSTLNSTALISLEITINCYTQHVVHMLLFTCDLQVHV